MEAGLYLDGVLLVSFLLLSTITDQNRFEQGRVYPLLHFRVTVHR